jgi:hypothetical protein
MHFTIGDLFRGLTICAVGLFVAVQYDPLLAARAVGVGLAISIAIIAWRHRRHWLWLGAAGMVLVGFLPTLFAAGVPFSHRDMVCYECGCSRDTHEVWGWKTQDDIRENDVSRWAKPFLPEDHVHQWITTSSHGRSGWFANDPIACGGLGEGAYTAWHIARLGKQPEAEALYLEYCEIRRGRSQKPLKQWNDEANAALEAALKGRNP